MNSEIAAKPTWTHESIHSTYGLFPEGTSLSWTFFLSVFAKRKFNSYAKVMSGIQVPGLS